MTMLRTRRMAVLVAALVLVLGVWTATTEQPARADGSISYVYSQSQSSFVALPAGSGGGGAGASYEYRYQDECVGMSDAGSPFKQYPDDGHTCLVLSQSAGGYTCATPDGGSNGHVAWRRPAGSNGVGERVGGVFCLDDADLVIPLAQVITNLREQLLRQLHTPDMQIRPTNSTLVNLGNVMWVDGANDDTPELTIPAPLTGSVWAKASYTWSFGDGSAGAEGRGDAFDGTLPNEAPGHYSVEHTYTSAGTYTASVTQAWAVFVDIPTYPGGDLDIDAPDNIQTAQITVVPSDPVNVAN